MERSPDFKIVVVYETFLTAIEARDMAGRLAAEFKMDGEVDCDFWKFELLGDPRLREQVAAEAAAAGMIIISAQAGGGLPIHVRTWIESWPEQRREDMAALVVLLDSTGTNDGEAPPVCEYLRGIANERGMDFFCKAGDWWEFELEPLQEIRRRQEDRFSHEEELFQPHQIGRGWGIND